MTQVWPAAAETDPRPAAARAAGARREPLGLTATLRGAALDDTARPLPRFRSRPRSSSGDAGVDGPETRAGKQRNAPLGRTGPAHASDERGSWFSSTCRGERKVSGSTTPTRLGAWPGRQANVRNTTSHEVVADAKLPASSHGREHLDPVHDPEAPKRASQSSSGFSSQGVDSCSWGTASPPIGDSPAGSVSSTPFRSSTRRVAS